MGATVAVNILADCRMVSIVWETKQAKGASSRLAASVAVLAEDIAGMAPFWVKTLLFCL